MSACAAASVSLYLAFTKYQVDMAVYLMGGQHARRADLYAVHIAGRPFLSFTYPPFAAVVFSPLSQMLALRAAQALWAVLNLALLFALITLSLRVVRPNVQRPTLVRWGLLAMAPALALEPVFRTVGLGQINLVLCVLVLFDVAGSRRLGPVTVPLGVMTGIAGAIKLTPLIFLAHLLFTRRQRGALNGLTAFGACTVGALVLDPHASLEYWTKDVFHASRAGALFGVSDQNIYSALSRLTHAPVSGGVLWAVTIPVAVTGLVIAASAHRRLSPMAGVLACAAVGLLVSPITWSHHLVWVVPAIVWLAFAEDAPSRGVRRALAAAVLFWAAPIWWAPTTWWPSVRPPELHENGWQLLVANSFVIALVSFLASMATLVWRRSRRSIPATLPANVCM